MNLKLLPQEVLDHIYEYDDSYKKYFSHHVLNEIWRHHSFNWFRNMIITKLFENSMIYDKERFFYIDKIILFDVETLRPTQRTPPIICKREDIEIKCFDVRAMLLKLLCCSL